jgi:hypothetical protein
MMIEGSGSESRAGSGSICLTSGSGSVRPKNPRIRIRIRNTAPEASTVRYLESILKSWRDENVARADLIAVIGLMVLVRGLAHNWTAGNVGGGVPPSPLPVAEQAPEES